MTEKNKKILQISISVVLVVVSVYYTLKDIDLVKLWHIIVHADYLWVLMPIPVSLLSHWVRAMRWKTMLKPIAKVHSTWNLFSAVMAGYAVNSITPRGGELLRPYIYARREKISFSSAFATIIVERFIDVIILLMMFAGVSFFFSEQIRTALPSLHADKFLIPSALIIGVLILSFWPPFVRKMLKVFIYPFSHKFYDKLSGIFDRFVKGFAIIRYPSQYFRLIVESLLIWLLYTIPLYMMFFSFGFQKTANLGFGDAILLIVISGIAFTIAPTPGAVGVYHLFFQRALVNLYGIGAEEALAYATVTHAINYLIQVIVGGLFILRENITKIPHKEEDIESELRKE